MRRIAQLPVRVLSRAPMPGGPLVRLVALAAIAMAQVWAQTGSFTLTTSHSSTQTIENTAVSVRADNFSTRITARVGMGPLLYDQTLPLPFSDPAVQALVTAAQNTLIGAGAGGCTTVCVNAVLLD
jgi:hypothetical protein